MEPKNITLLLKDYDSSLVKKVKKIKFEGLNYLDVYNITAPFKVKKKEYLLGRVELRDLEVGTVSMFFERKGNEQIWHRAVGCPVFGLQDPLICKIGDQIIVGGVEIIQKSVEKGLMYRNIFYKGSEISKLRLFTSGPWRMKGIRFVQLPDKRIGVFTRPQGKKGRRGKIGFEIFDSLTKITPRKISNVPLLKNIFARGEWGGVNDIHLLNNGKLGILGHIAKFGKDKKRYYYPLSFLFDYETKEISGVKILVTRSDIPKGEAKRDDLHDVIYPGGIVRNNGTAKLYVGVRDAESYEITIKDPFREYEIIEKD